MTEQYLINIAVGPVQEFIASARKLRDLWYGSYLLSELSKSVAKALHGKGCTLIFPAISDGSELEPGSSLNVANKILALSPQGSAPAELIKLSRDAFREHWSAICADAARRAGTSVIDTDMFSLQVEDFGEFYAAWKHYSPGKYISDLDRCEKLLAGRKNLREFTAPAWQGNGKPKSSLDGIRESVIIGALDRSRAFQVKEGEHLDALGIVKRFGPWNHTERPLFDNLAEVAALSFLHGLARQAMHSPEIAETLLAIPAAEELYPDKNNRPPATLGAPDVWPKEKGLSTELLHPAVLDDEREKNNGSPQSQAWQQMTEKLSALWHETACPTPYACLLVGDGDDMGKTLNTLSTPEAHQQFSRKLDAFADRVHEIVSGQAGKVIYSGGDDVLAYVPLHTVLACADAINTLFAETMTAACAGHDGIDIPTFSMGIAIVHMKMPLHEALDLARLAERTAKTAGKDRLAVIQSKRGGSDLCIHGKWQTHGRLPGLPTRLEAFAKGYNQGLLSSRMAYQLRNLSKECGGDLRWDETGRPGSPGTAEALHLICRKRKQGNTLTREEAGRLLAGQTDIRHLSDELVIALQLGRAMALGQAQWKSTGGNEDE